MTRPHPFLGRHPARRLLVPALLAVAVAVAPGRADAQLGRLRRAVEKKIVEKAGEAVAPNAAAPGAAAAGGAAPANDHAPGGDMHKPSARVIELTPESLDAFLKAFTAYDAEVATRGPEFQRFYGCRLEARHGADKSACGAEPAGWADGGNPYAGIERSVAKAHGYASTAEFLVVRERVVAYLALTRRRNDDYAAYKFKPAEREALKSREGALLATSLKEAAGIRGD